MLSEIGLEEYGYAPLQTNTAGPEMGYFVPGGEEERAAIESDAD